jgi:hypothetical protein
MKVKLLKKIRKRYNWYFNNEKFPVFIDKVKKTAKIYDLEYMSNRYNYSLEDVKEKVKIDHTEWALRCLKMDIIGPYGWDMSRVRYKLALKKYKRKLPK